MDLLKVLLFWGVILEMLHQLIFRAMRLLRHYQPTRERYELPGGHIVYGQPGEPVQGWTRTTRRGGRLGGQHVVPSHGDEWDYTIEIGQPIPVEMPERVEVTNG